MLFRSKTSAGFFEERYRVKPDPWKFATSAYEQGRFRSIVAALAHRHYARAFEPGCSIGTLTEHLASICDAVEACDFSPTAVELAQARCRNLQNVTIRCDALKKSADFEGFDLIILSEIGYYFRLGAWRKLLSRLTETAAPGTTVLASHWLGHSSDHRISGDEVHAMFFSSPAFRHEYGERNEAFRLDRFVLAGPSRAGVAPTA